MADDSDLLTASVGAQLQTYVLIDIIHVVFHAQHGAVKKNEIFGDIRSEKMK